MKVNGQETDRQYHGNLVDEVDRKEYRGTFASLSDLRYK
jgi:hypothetical protein